MSLIYVIIIAISLSMDAFSLSLAYGTLNMCKKDINILSIIVGIYHFFMPLVGLFIGSKIIKFLPITPDTVVFLVLLFIGLQMIIESNKEKNVTLLKYGEILIFGLAVSIDSFSVGLGLKTVYENPYIAALVFSISSFIFTYLGLHLGKRINSIVGKISTKIGGISLIVIGLLYLI